MNLTRREVLRALALLGGGWATGCANDEEGTPAGGGTVDAGGGGSDGAPPNLGASDGASSDAGADAEAAGDGGADSAPSFVLGETKPDAANTGLTTPASALEAVAGNVTFATDGQLVENKHFAGKVTVTAKDVRFVNCWFNGPGTVSNGLLQCTHDNVENLIVERCLFRPSSYSRDINGIFGKRFTLLRCDVSGVVDCVSIVGGNLAVDVNVLGCYLHDQAYFSPNDYHADNQSHSDTFQIHFGGRNIRIFGNTLPGTLDPAIGAASTPATTGPDGEHLGGNKLYPHLVALSVVMASPASAEAGLANFTFEKNWAGGGAVVINWPRSDATNVRIVDNRWTRGSYFGDDFTVLMRVAQAATITGNHYEDTLVPWNGRKNGG